MEDGTTRKTRGNERREGGGRAHHGGEAGLPYEPPIPPPGKRAAGRYAAIAGGLRNPLLALLPELFFFFLQMMVPELDVWIWFSQFGPTHVDFTVMVEINNGARFQWYFSKAQCLGGSFLKSGSFNGTKLIFPLTWTSRSTNATAIPQ
jgi:hypothetical protein